MFFFFFSSRRRHTRLTCDWSSDVCSSDLSRRGASAQRAAASHGRGRRRRPRSRDSAALARRDRRPGPSVRTHDRAAAPVPRAARAVGEAGVDRTDGGGGGARAAQPARESARGRTAGPAPGRRPCGAGAARRDRKSTRLNSSHMSISYAVFCLKKKKKKKYKIKKKKKKKKKNTQKKKKN